MPSVCSQLQPIGLAHRPALLSGSAPIALLTSLEPWANELAHPEKSCRYLNTLSARQSKRSLW